jgi:hypothetical protein
MLVTEFQNKTEGKISSLLAHILDKYDRNGIEVLAATNPAIADICLLSELLDAVTYDPSASIDLIESIAAKYCLEEIPVSPFKSVSNLIGKLTKEEADLYYAPISIMDMLETKVAFSSLATVATSGSYNDLADKPAIPTQYAATVNNQAPDGSRNIDLKASGIKYTPQDQDNSGGFFYDLLSAGALSISAAFNRIVSGIGILSQLSTTNKSSLVGAINEVNSKSLELDNEPKAGSSNPVKNGNRFVKS